MFAKGLKNYEATWTYSTMISNSIQSGVYDVNTIGNTGRSQICNHFQIMLIQIWTL